MFVKIMVTVLLIDAIVLMIAVLLQSGKGGGLAASFGGASAGDALFGARQAGNLLTKVTWWTAGIFLFIAFVMQMMSSRVGGPTSVLDQQFTAPPVQTAPPSGGASGGTAPVSPLQSLPTTPPPEGSKQPDATKKQP